MNMSEKQQIKYMRQALRLAGKGAGKVAPNPQVGAVIVKENRVIGSGYHRRFGGPHAEVEAIKSCRKKGNDPAGAIMFVTLEPCCHHGKTPPCTEAIQQAGIHCVEIATLDECELVAGKGAKLLAEQGIEVKTGCCEKEARRLNAGFFKLQKTGLPFVTLKWAQSIDGKLAWPAKAKQRWITNEKARRHVHGVRSRCGAVLVGIGTVLTDDPLLTVRLGRSSWQPRRIVLDSHLRIPLESQLVQTVNKAPLEIYTLQKTVDQQWQKVDALDNCDCQVRPAPEQNGRLDLEAVLKNLGQLGVTDVLVEGGAAILESFQQQNLADRMMAYIAPVIIGDKNVPAITFTDTVWGKPPPYQAEARLKDVNIEQFDGDVLIEGDIA